MRLLREVNWRLPNTWRRFLSLYKYLAVHCPIFYILFKKPITFSRWWMDCSVDDMLLNISDCSLRSIYHLKDYTATKNGSVITKRNIKDKANVFHWCSNWLVPIKLSVLQRVQDKLSIDEVVNELIFVSFRWFSIQPDAQIFAIVVVCASMKLDRKKKGHKCNYKPQYKMHLKVCKFTKRGDYSSLMA